MSEATITRGEQLERLAAGVRDEVADEVTTWRKLPYLALDAEGRDGFGTLLPKLYKYGLAEVNGNGSDGLYGTYVDCDNGEIVTLREPGKGFDLVRATTKQVVELVYSRRYPSIHAKDWMGHMEGLLVANARIRQLSPDRLARLTAWKAAVIEAKNLRAIFRREDFNIDAALPELSLR